jgi:hypothetical protein
MLSYGCRTQTSFQRERWYLINLGIPGEFLPERLDAVRPTAARRLARESSSQFRRNRLVSPRWRGCGE